MNKSLINAFKTIKTQAAAKFFFWIGLAMLIIILLFFQISSLSNDSQTVDEGPHILAGFTYLKTGKILLNPEHPPLLKAWAALPLLILNPDLPEEVKKASKIPAELDQWGLSGEFLYKNRVPAEKMIFWSRLMMIILVSAGAIGVAFATRAWFGNLAGLAAFFLFAFDPNVLAHGRIVTTDVGSGLLIFFTICAFFKFLKKPSTNWAVFSGIVLGLALASKFSSLVLVPSFFALLSVKLFQEKFRNNKIEIKKYAKSATILFIVSFAALWAIYGFNLEKPGNDPKVKQLYARNAELLKDPNAYHDENGKKLWLARFIIHAFDPSKQPGIALKWMSDNVPIPAYRYFRGLSDFLTHDYRGHYAYLAGNIYETGMWQYFIIAYLIKSPIPLLILLTASMCVFAVFLARMPKNKFLNFPLAGYALIIPPLIYWITSIGANLNIGIRHLMPIYPFYALMIAGVAAIILKKIPEHSPFFQGSLFFKLRPKTNLIAKTLFSVLMIWFIAEAALIYHRHLSYFNELIGGPKNGHKYLLDSNIDWGQDFLRLKQYIKNNNLDQVYLRYFGKADWDYYGVKGLPVPTTEQVAKNGPPDGVVAISLTPLFLFNIQEFLWLQAYQPTDRIGYSMWVYDFRK